MKTNPRRLYLEVYPFRLEIQTRLSDVDSLEHLNNVRLMECYQESRVAFHRALGVQFGSAGIGRVLVAHLSVDYLQETFYPDSLTLGVGVLRIGNSSYTLGLGMFQRGRCVGLSHTVLVNATENGAGKLPAEFIAILHRKMIAHDAL